MRGGSRNQERNTVAIRNQLCEQTCKKYIRIDFLGLCQGRLSLDQFNLLSCSCQLSSFEPSFPTHSLQIYCFELLFFVTQPNLPRPKNRPEPIAAETNHCSRRVDPSGVNRWSKHSYLCRVYI